MKPLPATSWALPALRVIVGAVFIDAGTMKIRDPEAFAVSLETLRLLPSSLAFLVALALPWLEVL